MSKKQSSPSSQVQKTEPKKESLPVRKFTVEEARNYIINTLSTTDTKATLKNFSIKYLPKIQKGNLSNDEEKELTKEVIEISQALGVETGFAIMNSVGDKYYGLAKEIKRNLQKEFNCRSYSEKMLVDLAIGSYISKLNYTSLLRQNQTSAGSDYNGYRNFVSKEIDRAHRQFISVIETLKFMKQPSMKVNIKTNNAFVGENQQFNNNVKNDDTK